MELIDKDKLIKEIDDMIFVSVTDYLQVIAAIDAMPTVESEATK